MRKSARIAVLESARTVWNQNLSGGFVAWEVLVERSRGKRAPEDLWFVFAESYRAKSSNREQLIAEYSCKCFTKIRILQNASSNTFLMSNNVCATKFGVQTGSELKSQSLRTGQGESNRNILSKNCFGTKHILLGRFLWSSTILVSCNFFLNPRVWTSDTKGEPLWISSGNFLE